MLKVYIKGAGLPCECVGYLMYYKIKLEVLKTNLRGLTYRWQGLLKGPYTKSIN